MAVAELNRTVDFNGVSRWLDQHLTCLPIEPVAIELKKVPEIKGIYCWFMQTEGYAVLSKFVKIGEINSVFTKVIKGLSYHLVYIGTAGTGKKGNSDLRERLLWHIAQAHTKSAVCSGTLSTLRAGIGSLLADDLIMPETEQLINKLFAEYFKVYWIGYPTSEYGKIDSHESILIRTLCPLLNLKNNPNAHIQALMNFTKTYSERRKNIIKSTRIRLLA